MKILILCTGNSCRSQMAEAYLKYLNPNLEVFSAGVDPAEKVSGKAVKVMAEIGIEMKDQFPKNVDRFLDDEFDYVITVCDHAKETCPAFLGKVKNRVHIGFEDPANAQGTEEEKLAFYRKVRDEIISEFKKFYKNLEK